MSSRCDPRNVHSAIKRDGLEKMMVSCMLLGDYDFHFGNVGVAKIADKYRLVKIDHGRAAHKFFNAYEIAKIFSGDKIDAWEEISSARQNISKAKIVDAIKGLEDIDMDSMHREIKNRVRDLKHAGAVWNKVMNGWYGIDRFSRSKDVAKSFCDSISINRRALEQFASCLVLERAIHPIFSLSSATEEFPLWVKLHVLNILSNPEFCNELIVYHAQKNQRKFLKPKYEPFRIEAIERIRGDENTNVCYKILALRILGEELSDDYGISELETQGCSEFPEKLKELKKYEDQEGFRVKRSVACAWLLHPTSNAKCNLEILRFFARQFLEAEQEVAREKLDSKFLRDITVMLAGHISKDVYCNFTRNKEYLKQFLAILNPQIDMRRMSESLRCYQSNYSQYCNVFATVLAHSLKNADGAGINKETLAEMVENLTQKGISAHDYKRSEDRRQIIRNITKQVWNGMHH